MLIKLKPSAISLCNSFATEWVALKNYDYKKQYDIAKIKLDITTGKLAELASFIYIRETLKDSTATPPDFTIRQGHYDTDIVGKFNYHCKSQEQSSAVKFGLSWSFDSIDVYRTGIKISNGQITDKELYIFSAVNADKGNVRICKVVKLVDLHANKLFKEPLKKSLQGTKKVIYYNDIIGM